MRKQRMSSRRCRRWLVPLAALLAALILPAGALAAQPVSGVVFNDYNGNGTRDGGGAATGVARDGGVDGVAVRAYGPGGGEVAATTTAGDGTYALQVPDGVPRVRVEFTGFPAGYFSGPHGANSGTTVQFVDLSDGVADTAVSLGILVPEDYCANNPLLASACFRFGPAIAGTQSSNTPVVMGFAYNPTGQDFQSAPGGVALATHQQIGAVYGLGFDARTGDLYAGAYFKRGTGFGSGGPGAIYRIPFTGTGGTGYGTPAPWATLPATTNEHTTSTDPQQWVADNLPASFDAVGKTSLGDVEVAADGSELYAVNLEDRQLHRVPLGGTPGTVGPGTPIPAPGGCPANDWRPFGLGVHRGTVYVGGVCSNQSANPVTAPGDAYVLSFNPASGSFSAPVLSFPLTYSRKCANDAVNRRGFPDNANLLSNCSSVRVAQWRAWVNAAQAPNVGSFDAYPQAMLSDIAFDRDAMVLGMRDRYGDQMGNAAYGPRYPANTSLLTGLTAGDLLRACPTGTTWALEANGSCGGGYVLLGGADDVGLTRVYAGERRFALGLEKARAMIKAKRGSELVPQTLSPMPLSWRSFLDTNHPDGDYNVFPFLEVMKGRISKKPLFRHLRGIRKPSLYLYGDSDEFLFGDVSGCVAILADAIGAKSNVEIAVLEDADHGFGGREEELGTLIAEWAET